MAVPGVASSVSLVPSPEPLGQYCAVVMWKLGAARFRSSGWEPLLCLLSSGPVVWGVAGGCLECVVEWSVWVSALVSDLNNSLSPVLGLWKGHSHAYFLQHQGSWDPGIPFPS